MLTAEKIQVLEKAKEYINDHTGMCKMIEVALRNDFLKPKEDVSRLSKQVLRELWKDYPYTGANFDSFWYAIPDKKSRLQHFDKTITRLKSIL
jgi:hypothetical protein